MNNDILVKDALHGVRKAFKKQYKPIKSGHIAEAVAMAYDYKSSVALNTDLREADDFNILAFDTERFATGLQKYYPELSIENVKNDMNTIISQNATFFFYQILSDAVQDHADYIHMVVSENDTILKFRVRGYMMPYENSFDKGCGLKLLQTVDKSDKKDYNHTYVNQKSILVPPCISNIEVQKNPMINGIAFLVFKLTYNKNRYNVLGQLMTEQQNILKRMAKNPQGLFLVSGPAGSGSSTTIQEVISLINVERYNNKMQINDFCDLTSVVENYTSETEAGRGQLLKDIINAEMRKDPDICAVGELRDASSLRLALLYSLRLALLYSLTGMKVLGKMSANSAIDTISRIFDILEFTKDKDRKFDIYENMIDVIMNQRLVRVLCPHCRVKDDQGFYHASEDGCDHDKCRHGYIGRTVIVKILEMKPDIWELCINKEYEDARHLWITKYNGITKKEAAKEKLMSGEISPEDFFDHFGPLN